MSWASKNFKSSETISGVAITKERKDHGKLTVTQKWVVLAQNFWAKMGGLYIKQENLATVSDSKGSKWTVAWNSLEIALSLW